MTLPVILAYARGGKDDRNFWRDAMSGSRSGDEDLRHAIGLVRATGALDDSVERARHYARRAIDTLAPFPNGKAKAALAEAAQFAVARAY
jgi:octaprenyl-diphosphate synthase